MMFESLFRFCIQKAGNGDHLKLLRDMGITIVGLPDGRVQLLHSYSQAKTTDDAEEGLIFMQEMVEISRSASSQPDNPPRIVSFQSQRADGVVREVVLKAGPAQFGLDLKDDVKVCLTLHSIPVPWKRFQHLIHLFCLNCLGDGLFSDRNAFPHV